MDAGTPNREQLAENMRLYADLRFKQLTLLIAVMTLAGAGVAQFQSENLVGGLTVRVAAASFALAFVAVSWIVEIRAVLYWQAHRKQVPDLWPTPPRNFVSVINSSNAVALLHAILYAFWFYCIKTWYPSILILIPASIGAVLLLFNVYVYRSHANHDEGNR